MRDFQRVKQKNPHVSFRRPQRSWRYSARVGFVCLFILVFLAATAPPLRFSSVVVWAPTDTGRQAAEEAINEFLNTRVAWLFSRRTLLFFRATLLEQYMRKVLPTESVSIAPKYRARALEITIAFRPPVARLELPNESVFIDREGKRLASVLVPVDKAELLVLQSASPGQYGAAEQVIPAQTLTLYQALQERLKATATSIVWLVLRDDPDTLIFQMKGDWELRALSKDEPRQVLKNLDAFFTAYSTQNSRRPLEYVDLRFADKVVYKEKE